jgi:hypothetical protein
LSHDETREREYQSKEHTRSAQLDPIDFDPNLIPRLLIQRDARPSRYQEILIGQDIRVKSKGTSEEALHPFWDSLCGQCGEPGDDRNEERRNPDRRQHKEERQEQDDPK